MTRRSGQGRSGFTLVELLVVLMLIAMLAVIVFPVFAPARERARSTSCRAQLHQLGLALHLYARDHDGRFPPQPHDWSPLVGPYANDLIVFRCPSDAGARTGGLSAKQQQGGLHPGQIAAPAHPFVTSYQYRGGLTQNERGDTPVAADWSFLHHERANVLYLNGEVRPLARDGWTPFTPGPRPGGTAQQRREETPFASIDPKLAASAEPEPDAGAIMGLPASEN